MAEHLRDHIALHELIAEAGGMGSKKFDPNAAIRSFRSHLIWYSKGLSEGAKFRQQVMTSECRYEISDLMHEFFSCGKKSPSPGDLCDDGIDYRQAFG